MKSIPKIQRCPSLLEVETIFQLFFHNCFFYSLSVISVPEGDFFFDFVRHLMEWLKKTRATSASMYSVILFFLTAHTNLWTLYYVHDLKKLRRDLIYEQLIFRLQNWFIFHNHLPSILYEKALEQHYTRKRSSSRLHFPLSPGWCS